jgi:hypothetical protein
MTEHNELKKGTRVRMPGLFGEGPRIGTLMDNQRGITRLVKIEESNGHWPDMGSVYVDEILEYEDPEGTWRPVLLSPKHRQRMSGVRDTMRSIFG